MKFAHYLSVLERDAPPQWSGRFIKYKYLKKMLKACVKDHQDTGDSDADDEQGPHPDTPSNDHIFTLNTTAEEAFFTELRSQLNSTNVYFQKQADKTITAFRRTQSHKFLCCFFRLHRAGPHEYAELAQQAYWCRKFARSNAVALRKILKKHDKVCRNTKGRAFLQDCWKMEGQYERSVGLFLHSPLLDELKAVQDVLQERLSEFSQDTTHLDTSNSETDLASKMQEALASGPHPHHQLEGAATAATSFSTGSVTADARPKMQQPFPPSSINARAPATSSLTKLSAEEIGAGLHQAASTTTVPMSAPPSSSRAPPTSVTEEEAPAGASSGGGDGRSLFLSPFSQGSVDGTSWGPGDASSCDDHHHHRPRDSHDGDIDIDEEDGVHHTQSIDPDSTSSVSISGFTGPSGSWRPRQAGLRAIIESPTCMLDTSDYEWAGPSEPGLAGGGGGSGSIVLNRIGSGNLRRAGSSGGVNLHQPPVPPVAATSTTVTDAAGQTEDSSRDNEAPAEVSKKNKTPTDTDTPNSKSQNRKKGHVDSPDTGLSPRQGAGSFKAEDLKCPICLEVMYKPVGLGCGHKFCRPCALEAAGFGSAIGAFFNIITHIPRATPCPQCRQKCAYESAVSLTELGALIKSRYPEEWALRRREDKDRKTLRVDYLGMSPERRRHQVRQDSRRRLLSVENVMEMALGPAAGTQ